MTVEEFVNKRLNNYDSETEELRLIVDEDKFFCIYKYREYIWNDCVKMIDKKTGDMIYYIWDEEIIFLDDRDKDFCEYPNVVFCRIPDWCTKAYEFYKEYKEEKEGK